MKRKLTCSVLALTIALGGVAYANPDLEAVDQNINAIQSELSGLQDVSNQITQIDAQTSELNGTLESLKSSENSLSGEIQNLAATYEDGKANMMSKVDEVYSKGNLTYEEMLLSNENMGEFFTQVDTLKKVVLSDETLYTQVKETKEGLNAKNTELESVKEQIAPLEVKINELKSQVNNYDEVKNKIDELNGQLSQLVAQKDELVSANVGSNVVNIANQYLGTPYVWGGTTPSGFDCSGFVQYVYAQAGVSIPRVTTGQEFAGIDVTGQELQPGDLVFWGARGATHHVGMYIGNGQYVHSPQTGDVVRVATLSNYSIARRILN